MINERPKNLNEHREHFAKFVALLTGELGVQAVFGNEAGSTGARQIVLPKLENVDAKRLDFLYALCLREAGLMSMSKRSVASIASHSTQGELGTSFAIESGRVERALMRKFAGASEILDHHWKREAADPELGPMAFGFKPAEANVDSAFAWAAKWALLGKPAYGWDKLFAPAAWGPCVAAIASEPFASLIKQSRLRKWDDSRELAGKLWGAWVALRGADETPALKRSPKAEALMEAEKVLREKIPAALAGLVAERDKAKAEAQAAQDKAKSILSQHEARLNELGRSITQINKQKAPFKEVAENLKEARHFDAEERGSLAAAEQAKQALEGCKQAADERRQAAEAAAAERAAKDKERADQIEANARQMAEKKEALEALTPQQQARIDELERKIEQAREAAAQKKQEAESKIQDLEAKAEKAEGSKKEQLQKKIEELQQRLAEQQEKAAQAERKLEERRQEIQESAQEKAASAKERLDSKIAELEEKLAKAQHEAQARQEKTLEKGAATGNITKRAEKSAAKMASEAREAAEAAREARAAREAAAQAAKKNKEVAGMSEEDLLKKVEELQAALEASKVEKGEIEKPAKEARGEAKEANAKAKEANKKAYAQAHGELQKLQDQMDAQGIPCELVERLEEIEGWGEANQIQAEFDARASKDLGEPVVNGAGGGAGGRNVLESIELKAQGIEEINPNDIFEGIEKLSPLSGFSESGALGGDGLDSEAPSAEAKGLSSAKPHVVWSRERDKVIPAPKKDVAVATKIKAKYAKEIAQVKKVFAARMKPSFKSKFRGGREEGQLDNREIWRLAAKQGDDFYEVDCKRPDNKASASILVDISGSLASLGAEVNEKLQACALMLSEGLGACNIEHEILGFNAPFEMDFAELKIPDTFNRKGCRLETVVAKNFTDKSVAGLASLEVAQADNSDGESVRIALGRLKKRSGKKKILFLISDGKPFMQDSDPAILDEDLRRALVEAATQKIAVVSIGFGEHGHPVLGAQHIGIAELGDLAAALDARLARER